MLPASDDRALDSVRPHSWQRSTELLPGLCPLTEGCFWCKRMCYPCAIEPAFDWGGHAAQVALKQFWVEEEQEAPSLQAYFQDSKVRVGLRMSQGENKLEAELR